MRTKNKLVFGWGVNDSPDEVGTSGRKQKRSYAIWIRMLRHASTSCCTVCNEWKSFTTFERWLETQDQEGKVLSILFADVTVYSPATTAFIPDKLSRKLHRTVSGVTPSDYSYIMHYTNLEGKRKLKRYRSYDSAKAAHTGLRIDDLLGALGDYTDPLILDGLQSHITELRRLA